MTGILLTVGATLGFFALIMVSIALHELGHFIPGKLSDVKVTEYFIGFGRTLWSRRRGETEYGIKAVPLGGYCRLVGMYPPRSELGPRKDTWVNRLADRARSLEYETITPADQGRLFYQKPLWQKLAIMAGGVLTNLVLAFVIFAGVNLAWGQYLPQLTVAQVSECMVPADRTDKTCRADDPVTPAARAGIRVGDRIVSFNGHELAGWDQLADLIRANRDGPAAVVVERDGTRLALPVVRTVITGVPDRLDPTRRVEAGFFGVSPSQQRTTLGPGRTASQMWTMTGQNLNALASFPVKTWNVAADLLTGKPRDVNGPISIVGASRVAGEIANAGQLPLGDRIAGFFSLLGSVNLFVGLLNLVPLPPLDGGHVVGALWDWVRRGFARATGRPDPGPFDTARMLPVAYVVGGFLVLAGLVLILADVLSPVSLF